MSQPEYNINIDPWEQLSVDTTILQSVFPELIPQFRWYKDSQGFVSMLYECKENLFGENINEYKSFSFTYIKERGFLITLKDFGFKDRFYDFCYTILSDIDNEQKIHQITDSHIARIIIRTINDSQRFWATEPSEVLSRERQIGLIGELIVLKDCIIKSELQLSDAINAWEGAVQRQRAPKDFVINKIGIESKARAKQSAEVNISSEDQLSIYRPYQLDHLFLYVTDISETSENHIASFTLPSLVDEVYRYISEVDFELSQQFLHLVGNYKYYTEHKEDYKTIWCVDNTLVYEIDDNFPSISNENIMEGISDVRYKIDLDECNDFLISNNELIKFLNGYNQKQETNSIKTPEDINKLIEDKNENKYIEFKSTFSKSIINYFCTGCDEDFEEIPNPFICPSCDSTVIENKLEKKDDLETKVLQTISAFINTDGGTLLIGIKEKNLIKKVIGIEKDRYENNDWFLMGLTKQITNRIGKPWMSLINFDLISMSEDVTVCVVECKSAKDKRNKRKYSPAPLKTGYSTNEATYKYYERIGNKTEERTGSDLGDLFMSWK
tara:strand:+ start:4954 stop:6615 length:1662 start_codon:yes stop_codon:yes gene_type:complete